MCLGGPTPHPIRSFTLCHLRNDAHAEERRKDRATKINRSDAHHRTGQTERRGGKTEPPKSIDQMHTIGPARPRGEKERQSHQNQ
ncbi:hypothetical protein RRG08_044651 [Elysia crispata]|uniref:Uncharacterized protein n=1 Tax=Elysia crispata TaxID=231223 RepID=A0AAE1EAU9_9GAST|nr:hypothetical protein RRG08_044651 [Elysia crispata]